MPVPVVITDHDDPDNAALCSLPNSIHFALGLEYDRYRISIRNLDDWEIEVAGVALSAKLLGEAAVVVYRRWRSSPPVPPVIASATSDPAHRSFVERQWSSTIDGLLSEAYRRRSAPWFRDPSATDDKLRTLHRLHSRVATPVSHIARLPPANGRWVWKPIDVDQSCGAGRASTIFVQSDDHDLQPCPGLYQQFIDARYEIRVGYAFGHCRAVAQYRSDPAGDPVDLRYASPRREACSDPALDREAASVSAILGLEMYTADVLVDAEGKRFWCDVNPDGLYCGADTNGGHLSTAITDALASIDSRGRK